MTRRTFAFSLFLAGAIALVGCSQSQVTITLDLVVTAADVAVSTLETTGQIPAPIANEVTSYLGQVTTAVDFATTELATTDTAAIKATKITSEFAALALPQLPPGGPAAIVATINAVAQAIGKFLATIQTTSAQLETPGALAFAGSSGSAKLNSADKKALPKIAARNAAVKAKLKALQKR